MACELRCRCWGKGRTEDRQPVPPSKRRQGPYGNCVFCYRQLRWSRCKALGPCRCTVKGDPNAVDGALVRSLRRDVYKLRQAFNQYVLYNNVHLGRR